MHESAVPGLQGSAQPPAKKTAGLIEKETTKSQISVEICEYLCPNLTRA